MEKRLSQQAVKEEAEVRVAELEREIDVESQRLGFLHAILTKTGEELVKCLSDTLHVIGFEKVERPAEEAGPNKQEDLQIHDRSPSLLIEVKGLRGQPSEDDTHQVTKYVVRRMKEWGRTDVGGVCIVNHQRNLPALERDHARVFTDQQVKDAAETGTGLVTTWDLFRLVRGMVRWRWPAEKVQDVFYGKGHLPAIPSHYLRVGTVAHFYTDISVLSIDVEGLGLRVGDTVGFLLATAFVEERISSLQVNKEPVDEARVGQRAGYVTALQRQEIPVGTVVHLVQRMERGKP